MIGLCNVDKNMSSRLSKFLDVKELDTKDSFSHLDGIFFNWVDKMSPEKWTKQAALMDIYTKKKIPIVLFDRYLSISRKEYNWLKKFRVFFFEPAINYRRGFSYLPQWVVKPDFTKYTKDKEKREYDIAYKCNNLKDNLKSFEKYYLEYAKLYPDKDVVYSTHGINRHKEKQYKEFDLKRVYDFSFSQSTFTIAIDTQKKYDIGYLNENVFNAMENNCLPLLPIEHKYFNALFSGLIIAVWSDLNFCVDMIGKYKEIIIEEIYDRVEKYYPEFMIDNAVEVIIEKTKLEPKIRKLDVLNNSEDIFYEGKNLGSRKQIKEMIDTAFKVLKEFKKTKKDKKNLENQILMLANFLMKNFEEKICGSAVDTAIIILSDVKSIEYNNGSKEIYENDVIVGANGTTRKRGLNYV